MHRRRSSQTTDAPLTLLSDEEALRAEREDAQRRRVRRVQDRDLVRELARLSLLANAQGGIHTLAGANGPQGMAMRDVLSMFGVEEGEGAGDAYEGWEGWGDDNDDDKEGTEGEDVRLEDGRVLDAALVSEITRGGSNNAKLVMEDLD